MKPIEKIVLAAFLSLICFGAGAQNKNDAYQEFVKQRNQQYTDWRKKANAEFSDYLAKAWEEFLVQTGRKDPIGPVPDKPVYYNAAEDRAPASHGLPAEEDMCFPATAPKLSLSASYIPSESVVNIDFFGVKTDIPFDKAMLISGISAKEKDVASAWSAMSQTSFLPTVDAISEFQSKYSLSDWATYMLIKRLTEAVYSESNINERVATQMFLLCQMKYKVRVGSAGEDLVLLLPFKEQIYQISYITDSNRDFFIFGYTRIGSQTPLYSFTKDFSVDDNIMSLTISKPMAIGGTTLYKKVNMPLWKNILGDDVVIPVNQPYISFTLDYPQSDLIMYHNSAVDNETAKAVIRAVKFKILNDGMNKLQAVSYILNLVQNGFEYKTDYEMFGRSKPLFIEESFYYGANNCKDRVLIFSWLIKNTVGLNTVMFGYPNHVACGVEFPVDVKGDSFNYNGHKYVMCDPTFINAPIGATMTKYKGMDPEIMSL